PHFGAIPLPVRARRRWFPIQMSAHSNVRTATNFITTGRRISFPARVASFNSDQLTSTLCWTAPLGAPFKPSVGLGGEVALFLNPSRVAHASLITCQEFTSHNFSQHLQCIRNIVARKPA